MRLMNNRTFGRIPLFATLADDEIRHLLMSMKRGTVDEGTLLIREGDRGDCFYLIGEGQVEVIKALGTQDERLLSVLGPGDSFGEMSLLDPDGLRAASVRAKTLVNFYEMTHADFNALLEQRPAIAFQIARALSQRLRASDNAAIRDLHAKNRQLAQAYLELQQAQAQLIEKEKLEREMQLAREVQQSMLPRSLPQLPGFDFGAVMVPACAVGGDFFDFISMGPDILGIAVGDVSGKGVPAAIFMAMTRSLIRSEARSVCSPRKVLEGVNKTLLDMNGEGMFVTLLFGVLNRITREFSYIRAGHPPPIRCDNGSPATELSKATGQPLGIIDEPVFNEQSIFLHPGSMLLVYTDGITEAKNTQGEFFGVAKLLKTMSKYHNCLAQNVADSLMQAVTGYQGGTAQYDDVTIVVTRAC